MGRVRIIADVGSNWRGKPDEPLKEGRQRWRGLIRECADAGVDIVKGQYLRSTVYPEGSAEAQLVAGYEWPADWLPFIREECYKHGLDFLCTVFEPAHVPVLDPFVPAWKIASFEASRTDLWDACLATEKPLIVSTGLLDGASAAGVGVLLGALDTLLLCVSKYPASVHDYDLNVLRDWATTGHCRVGLSDHTHPSTGAVLAVGAVALGATLIETHVTLTHHQESPDAGFARTPRDLKSYVADIRLVETALGDGVKRVREGEVTHYRYDPGTGKRGTAAPSGAGVG
jgi:sialic acid synthase SpsE